MQLEIPSNDTTYWCSVQYLPENVRQQEKYIYKVSYYLQMLGQIKFCNYNIN